VRIDVIAIDAQGRGEPTIELIRGAITVDS
jgi:hypothetical protein